MPPKISAEQLDALAEIFGYGFGRPVSLRMLASLDAPAFALGLPNAENRDGRTPLTCATRV
jgi:hypothetical protein